MLAMNSLWILLGNCAMFEVNAGLSDKIDGNER